LVTISQLTDLGQHIFLEIEEDWQALHVWREDNRRDRLIPSLVRFPHDAIHSALVADRMWVDFRTD
jgi:hypothetical protein